MCSCLIHLTLTSLPHRFQDFKMLISGDVMPQIPTNTEGRRRMRRRTFKGTGQVNGRIPGTCFVNPPVVPSSCPASTRTSKSVPAVTLNGSQPQGMVNGYINYRYKGRSTKSAQIQDNRVSAVTGAPATGRVSCGGVPDGILVNGTTGRDSSSPEHNLLVAVKNQRRGKKSRHKKR